MMETTTHTTPQSGLSFLNSYNPYDPTNGNFVCSSPAFENTVTSYASRVLSYKSPPECCFDSSVASYVVSTLQSTFSDSPTYEHNLCDAHISAQDLDEYQSLMELLEEHCNMSTTVARDALESITKAVRTGIFDPHWDSTLQPVIGSSPGELGGMLNLGGSHVGRGLGRYRSKSLGAEHDYGHEDIDSIALLGNMLQQSGRKYSSSLFSSLIADEEDDGAGIIEEEPSFLLEEEELPRTPHKKEFAKHVTPLTSEETSVTEDFSTIGTDTLTDKCQSMTPLKPDRLIPVDLLGSIDDLMIDQRNNFTLAPIPNLSAHTYRGKKKSKVKSKDLAAALFISRPRSNSLQLEKSPKLKPMSAPFVPYGNMSLSGSLSSVFQKQVDSTVQMLMAMNFDICEDVAYEAALVSNADVNVAQHVIDGAVAAPAVCRHMLNGGCYRSDCQFSHDVDGHTCSFWLRGRCGKGNTCRFMHGFSKKLLDGVKVKYLPGHQSNDTYGSKSNSDTKPISIRTANLVQHNMKTSSSFPNQGGSGMSLFRSASNESMGFSPDRKHALFNLPPAAPSSSLQSASPESTGFSPDRKHVLFNRPPVAPSSSLPTRTFALYEKEPTPFSLDAPDNAQSISPTKVKETVTELKAFSFARIASSGYDKKSSYFDSPSSPLDNIDHGHKNSKTVRIPQTLWTACYNRTSTAFHIRDPIERYKEVSSHVKREDIVDLHFQSVKSFSIVLSKILPDKLRNHSEVWVVTGNGHHVARNTHQRSGGILENSLIDWLTSNKYRFLRGKDKNGFRGAVLVKR